MRNLSRRTVAGAGAGPRRRRVRRGRDRPSQYRLLRSTVRSIRIGRRLCVVELAGVLRAPVVDAVSQDVGRSGFLFLRDSVLARVVVRRSVLGVARTDGGGGWLDHLLS